jgi:Helix-turn-helix domain
MAEFANPYQVLSNQINDVRSLVLDLKKNQVPTIGTPEAPDRYVSGEETQKLLGGVSAPTLWEWRNKKIITGYRIGNKVMYKYSELMACGKLIVQEKK